MQGNFNQLIQSDTAVLVDFFAVWCGPCKAQAPILVDVARRFSEQLRVIKIDVDKNREIAQRYQVQSVPTLAVFKNGQLLWKQAGMVNAATLESVVKQYI
jgi:thioredoxin 1